MDPAITNDAATNAVPAIATIGVTLPVTAVAALLDTGRLEMSGVPSGSFEGIPRCAERRLGARIPPGTGTTRSPWERE